jgi:hypothetical protein
MNDLEHLAEKYDTMESAWDESAPIKEPLEIKAPLDKVVPIRLSAEHWAALRREAHDQGIGPTTLARMWLIERLRQSQYYPVKV